MTTERYSDETLMAYVDHELDAASTAALEAAMQTDAALAERVARQRALSGRLRHAFDAVLDEPVPARLLAAAQGVPAAPTKVVPLAQAREQRAARDQARRLGWPQWSGMGLALAACLMLGLWLGRPGPEPWANEGGRLVAQGELARALSTQLASSQAQDAPVRIGVSFAAKSGEYCRSFALAHGPAGLACKDSAGAWRVPVLAEAGENNAAYRQAASATPAAVLGAIDAQIAGEPLDAEAERAAAQRGWRR
ncbi:MAG TPA: hypothetical protein VFV25_09475 [Methylibium sp.]